MKLLFDYFPIICFFIAYKFYGIFVATAVAMAASAIQIGFYWLRHRKFEKLHAITFVLVILFGSMTLIFHDSMFIKWKVSLVYWAFAIALAVSHFSKKPIIQRMLSDQVTLPGKVWSRLNAAWAAFFLLLGGINLYVVYHYSTNSWVNFKLFGTLGLTLLFVVLQAIYMASYLKEK